MKDYHDEWLADRERESDAIDAAYLDILRSGYGCLGDAMLTAPEVLSIEGRQRANR